MRGDFVVWFNCNPFFVCLFCLNKRKKKENETQAGVLLASKQTNTNEFELAIVQEDLDSRIHQVNAQ